MKKINLKEFQSEKLSVDERLQAKGGSGITYTRRSYTSSTGADTDCKASDWDCG
ncbi:hypothetical protein [Kordia sp.]|uniref:hypothetical protein n=1 Tax=Kordia sp. TaxID=1965332 RepID=UPI0025C4E073|nr:hypothetical protein [Kordia sp.]MCH2192761.1 hypothetical protein [Kordia sp.]